MQILALLLCLLSTIHVAEAFKYKLTPYYRMERGRGGSGGCYGHITHLRTAYDEAMDMANGAKDAIEFLRSAQPDSKSDLTAHRKWNKAAKLLFELFGIPVNGNQNPQDPGILAKFDKIKDVFNKVTAHSQDTTLPLFGVDHKRIVCTDKDAIYIPDGTTFNRVPGAKDSDVWYFPHLDEVLPRMRPFVWKVAKQATVTTPVCHKGNLAATNIAVGATVFCPLALEQPVTQKEKARDMVAKRLPDGSPDEDASTKLDAYESLSRTMLHEFIHLHVGLHDATVDVNAMKKGQNLPPKRYKVYGWSKSTGLAITEPSQVLNTVDTFVMFALAMSWPKLYFDGPSGAAKDIEYIPSRPQGLPSRRLSA